ncbi:bifunctional pyr operon transcriptional regulator/uracil phosphoribosyltransferase PyrR [bacterium]|nr:bifunctional pyr operon transcriptional regulator/uracil phosphoribosyltransferase PyrR [bacterium]MBU1752866.1 bifunctional pyr operon transcriptional regulator/uracil phosphoribosyltransferase PyrR [bacterium]
MKLTLKSQIMDANELFRTILRLSYEMLERNKGTQNLAIIGIRSRGVPIAERIVKNIASVENCPLEMGVLDITLYRDDLTAISDQPVVKPTQIPFDITGKKIILIDDVLYTGRTVRCAIDQLMDFGRPASIQLAVIIDRGHRELPIQADYIGNVVATTANEVIEVRLEEIDGRDEVLVCER